MWIGQGINCKLYYYYYKLGRVWLNFDGRKRRPSAETEFKAQLSAGARVCSSRVTCTEMFAGTPATADKFSPETRLSSADVAPGSMSTSKGDPATSSLPLLTTISDDSNDDLTRFSAVRASLIQSIVAHLSLHTLSNFCRKPKFSGSSGNS